MKKTRFFPALLLLLALLGCKVTANRTTQTPFVPPTPAQPAAAAALRSTGTPTSAPMPPTLRPSTTQTTTPTAAAARLAASPTVTLTAAPQASASITVPILLYHRVTDKTGPYRYAVTTANFQAQMKTLAEAGYHTVTISQLTDALTLGSALPDKPVAITFDDAYVDVYANAWPVMQKYHFTATLYVITGTLGTDKSYGYLQDEAIQDLAAQGWEIGSHSVSHSDLKTSTLGLGVELKQSKKTLETLLGVPVRSFAYPYAAANAWIRQQIPTYGYDSAVGVGIINTHTLKTLDFLTRREVYYTTTLKEFGELLK